MIGLYIAFVLPVFLRFRLGDRFEQGAWSLGKHYKWIDVIALPWVAFIAVLFSLPLFKAGLPWDTNFSWSLTNYTILWFAAIGLFFGGWWVLSAKNWFKGPVRMGTEAELEQIEAVGASSSAALPAPCKASSRQGWTEGAARRPPSRLGLMRRLRYVVCDVFTDIPLDREPARRLHGRARRRRTDDAGARQGDEPLRVGLRAPASSGDADVRIRIFTPARELPFAGHPTLGARSCSAARCRRS